MGRRRRLFRRALVILVGAAVAASAPAVHGSPATTLPPGLTVSLQDDHLPVTAESNIGSRVSLLASTGVRVTSRHHVLWNAVARSRTTDRRQSE